MIKKLIISFFNKKALLCWFFVFFTSVFSYSQSRMDTIKLKEFSVQASRIPAFYSGVYKADSVLINSCAEANISDLLSKIAPVAIKNYGAGNLSTFSFRGVSSSQSAVLWNGLSIKSPLNGSADLSQLPVGFFDEATVSLGSRNMQESTSSAVSLCLDNKPNWNDHLKLRWAQMYSSVKNSTSSLSLEGGTAKWHSILRIYNLNGENSFSYKNYLSAEQELIQSESPIHLLGFLNENYRRFSNGSVLSLKAWYQKGDRFLSPIMSKESSERQNDESIRLAGDYNIVKQKYSWNLMLSMSDETLRYRNSVADIDSKHHSISKLISSKYSRNINKLILQAGGGLNRADAVSDEYDEDKDLTNMWLFFDAQYSIFERLTFTGALREDRSGTISSPILPLFGGRLQLLKNKNVFIKGNYSKRFHSPCLNDLYWFPGGNPDLLPEESQLSEMAVEFDQIHITKWWIVNAEISAYSGKTKNLIQWIPGESGIWQAQNVRNVETRGVEVNWSNTINLNRSYVKVGAMYSYNLVQNLTQLNAADLSYKKQLIYMPANTLKGNCDFHYKRNYCLLFFQYVGKRYLSTDNEWFLPDYQVLDIALGRDFQLKKFGGGLQFKIENVLDKEFQSIALRPMPGRIYSLSLRINFLK